MQSDEERESCRKNENEVIFREGVVKLGKEEVLIEEGEGGSVTGEDTELLLKRGGEGCLKELGKRLFVRGGEEGALLKGSEE